MCTIISKLLRNTFQEFVTSKVTRYKLLLILKKKPTNCFNSKRLRYVFSYVQSGVSIQMECFVTIWPMVSYSKSIKNSMGFFSKKVGNYIRKLKSLPRECFVNGFYHQFKIMSQSPNTPITWHLKPYHLIYVLYQIVKK